MLVFGLYNTVGYTLTTASGIFAGQRTERRIFSAQNFSFAQNLVYKVYIWANGIQSWEKHHFKSQNAKNITKLSILGNSTWNASFQSKIYERLFTFIDWKESFKKSQIYLFLKIFDQVSEPKYRQKIHECFLSDTFSISYWNHRITKTKFQTKRSSRTFFRSFFLFSNERALVVPQLSYNVMHFIYWCRKFSIHKTSKQWLFGETDSINGRKHWVAHQLFLTNQASLRVAKLQVSFYFPKTVWKTSICKIIRKYNKQSPDVVISQLEYTFSFPWCL